MLKCDLGKNLCKKNINQFTVMYIQNLYNWIPMNNAVNCLNMTSGEHVACMSSGRLNVIFDIPENLDIEGKFP